MTLFNFTELNFFVCCQFYNLFTVAYVQILFAFEIMPSTRGKGWTKEALENCMSAVNRYNKRWWWIYLPWLWQIISTVDRQLCDLLFALKNCLEVVFWFRLGANRLGILTSPACSIHLWLYECKGKNCFSLRLNNVLRVGFII